MPPDPLPPTDQHAAQPARPPEPEEEAPRPIRPRTLAVVGVLLAGAAIFGVVHGIGARATTDAELKTWANEQAVPTVALVQAAADTRERSVTLPGTIQAYYNAPIYPRVTGYVRSWTADIGSKVTKGQVLAEVDTPDLDQQLAHAQAELASATAADQLAAVTATRWQRLLSYQTVSEQDQNEKASDALSKHAAMQAAAASLGQLQALAQYKQIQAPFDGVVTARRTDIGDLVVGNNAGPALFQISDMHRVRIYVQVPQAFAGDLARGLQAKLTVPQYPDRTFDATLVTTARSFDEASRTVQVELQADNGDDKLWPGTFTEVSFQVPPEANVLRVPATALVFDAKGTRVAVLGPGDKVLFKPVTLGRNLSNDAEVLSGLTPADRIIDSPPEWLAAGDQVKLQAPPGGAAAAKP